MRIEIPLPSFSLVRPISDIFRAICKESPKINCDAIKGPFGLRAQSAFMRGKMQMSRFGLGRRKEPMP